MCSADDTMDLTIHFAGYDKSYGFFLPELYEINILQKIFKYHGNTGIAVAGANDYFMPFTEKIKEQINLYNLQDAVDICCLAIDMSRRLEKHIDFRETISDFDMVAITLDGLQWLKKAKLEVRQ
jgi:hypothetical protein